MFEIRILHGYYLDYRRPDKTKKPGVFFEYGTVTNVADLVRERAQLQAEVLEEDYDIRQDIFIEPTPDTARLMRGLKMVTKTLPWGLVAGLEVREEVGDGGRKYYPKAKLDESTAWRFLIGIRNNQLLNITNHAYYPSLPAYYHFSNLRANEDGKAYPSLSVRLPAFDAERTWEMGELIRENDVVKIANKETRVAGDFSEMFQIDASPKKNTWHQAAHTMDRVLLPKTFFYRFDAKFDAVNPVSTARFVLRDDDGQTLKEITASFSDGFPSGMRLDFKQLPVSENASEEERLAPKELPDGWYELHVTINDEATRPHRILMRSDLPLGQPLLGMVELSLGDTDDAFRLLDEDGALNRSENALGKSQHRLFEIRLLNRLSYWRYALKQPLSRKPTDKNYTYTDNTITTSKPRRLAKVRVPTSIAIGDASVPLPDPGSPALQYDAEQDIYYAELFLTTINPA